MLDAVLGERRLVGLLRRERDGAAARHVEAVAEQGAQLVLRGDHGHACAGIVEGFHDRGRAHEARIVHHHFLPRRRVVEVIPGDPVNAGRSTRDDRDVVRVGEARDHRARQQVRAVLHQSIEIGRKSALDGGLDVAGLRAVHADHDGGGLGPLVGRTVDADGLASTGRIFCGRVHGWILRRRGWRRG